MTEPVFNISWYDDKAQRNLRKHGVSFAQAATVMLDPLALTVFDKEHSQTEERWFTLGQSSDNQLLAIAHTYQVQDTNTVNIRLISAREATQQERRHYQNNPQVR